jgi:ADP-dependent NAD(P)H-hydrate dehydratase / NAD(P)H-hydrate epimerase
VIPLLTVEQIRTAEESTISEGRSVQNLMAAAARGVADAILREAPSKGLRALVLCGPGNNGGDGLVVADHLAEAGWDVTAWLFQRSEVGDVPVSDGFQNRVSILKGGEIGAALESVDVVLDALFGVGLRADLPDEIGELFAQVAARRRNRGLTVWALDVPSGMNADSGEIAEGALLANRTAMVGLPKIGAFKFPAARFTGRIELIDIGLEAPDDLASDVPRLLTIDYPRRVLPERRAGLHKRTAGTAMVVGGAPNYYGAPRMAAEAALRSGCGLVSVAAPSSVVGAMAAAVAELVFVPLPMAEHGRAGDRMASQVRKHLEGIKALVIGPGLGTDDPVPDFLSSLLGLQTSSRRGIGFGLEENSEDEEEPFDKTAVFDADALNWLATQDGWEKQLEGARLVLTPHPGEMARLLHVEREVIEAEPWEHARDAAKKFNQVVVLKHGHTVVATPDGELTVAPQAPTSLATAGTGDVLSGIIGSLLGQGLKPADAARAGVVIGLHAAELAELEYGPVGLLASDIIARIPWALSRYYQ